MRGPRARTIARWGAVTCAVIGGLVALGWVLGVVELVSVVPGYPPLHLNGAVALLAAGAGLYGIAEARRGWLLAGALVTLVIGGLTLVEYMAGVGPRDRPAPPFRPDRIRDPPGISRGAWLRRRRSHSSWSAPHFSRSCTPGPRKPRAGLWERSASPCWHSPSSPSSRTAPVSSATSDSARSPAWPLAVPSRSSASAPAWWPVPGSRAGPALLPGWVPLAAGVATLCTTLVLTRAVTSQEEMRGRRQVQAIAGTATAELVAELQSTFKLVARIAAFSADQSVTNSRRVDHVDAPGHAGQSRHQAPGLARLGLDPGSGGWNRRRTGGLRHPDARARRRIGPRRIRRQGAGGHCRSRRSWARHHAAGRCSSLQR